jgi:adenylate cyclase
MRGARSLHLLFLALLGLAVAELAGPRLLYDLDQRLIDASVRRHAAQRVPDADIVVVDIDESSLARLQDEAGSWPWPRAVYAELVLGLLAQQPRAILFDILFAEADRFRPDSDAAFIAALAGQDRVYLPMLRLDPADDARGLPLARFGPLLGAERTDAAVADAHAMLLPPAALPPESWRTGVINFVEDRDGVGRRYPLFMDVHGWRLPSLPARVARDLGYVIPEGDTLLLDWRGTMAQAYPRVSFADLYVDFQRRARERPADEFRDRIVIIGTAASGLRDLRVTPLGSLYPGVDILATALDNLKNGRAMREAPTGWPIALSGLLLAALWLAFRRHWHAAIIGVSLMAATLALLAGAHTAVATGWRVSVLVPLLVAWTAYLGGALLAYVREKQAREQAVRLFARFLNPEVVDRLVARGETVESLSGRAHEISVLFSDIRGFTTLSEQRTPQQVVDLLNHYFSLQVAVVFRHGGTLDKFIGDCIMAFWGAPLVDPQHAQRAVACALEMQRTLAQFKTECAAELGDLADGFDIGIGIHSGPAVVGFIGAEQKLEYTAIGDTVNLASRIEGLTKGLARVLVSADTAAACANGVRFRPRGSYTVKGRQQAVELFEPEQDA